MKLLTYTVYDNRALIYNQPFYAPTDGAALRMFEELANDTSTSVGRHPGDYTLFLCASYDDQAGAFWPISPLIRIADAVALVRLQPQLPLDRSNPGTDAEGGKSNGSIPPDFLGGR